MISRGAVGYRSGLSHTTGVLIASGPLPQLTLAQVASDSFGGATGPVSGRPGWAAMSDGTMSVVSSGYAAGTASAQQGDYRTDAYTSNQYSQYQLGSNSHTLTQYLGLLLNYNASTNACYQLIYYSQSGVNSGNPQFVVYKRTAAGAFTQIGSNSFNWGSFGNPGDTIGFYNFGGELVCTYNGSALFSVFDSTLTGGAPGIGSFGTLNLTNWQGGNVTMGAALGAAIASDSFTYSNGKLSVVGTNWTAVTGVFDAVASADADIVTGQVSETTPVQHYGDSRTEAYNADQWATIAMGATAGVCSQTQSPFVMALARWNGTSGYIFGWFGTAVTSASSGATYELYKITAGGTSALLASCYTDGGSGIASPSNPTGTTYTIVCKGTRISGRVNGCEVVSAIDSGVASGRPGFLVYPTITADNFSAGNVFGAPANSYVAAVLADSPTCYYRLNDTGTTAVDQMGGTAGTYSGTYTQSASNLLPTQAGASTNFGGGGMAVPDNAATRIGGGDFTVEMWIRNSGGFTQYTSLIDQSGRNYSFYWMGASSGFVGVGGTPSSNVSTGITMATATTYHFVFVRASGTTTVYVNGVAGGNTTNAAASNSATGFSICLNPAGGATPMAGQVQEVALYSHALTPARILAHYNAG